MVPHTPRTFAWKPWTPPWRANHTTTAAPATGASTSGGTLNVDRGQTVARHQAGDAHVDRRPAATREQHPLGLTHRGVEHRPGALRRHRLGNRRQRTLRRAPMMRLGRDQATTALPRRRRLRCRARRLRADDRLRCGARRLRADHRLRCGARPLRADDRLRCDARLLRRVHHRPRLVHHRHRHGHRRPRRSNGALCRQPVFDEVAHPIPGHLAQQHVRGTLAPPVDDVLGATPLAHEHVRDAAAAHGAPLARLPQSHDEAEFARVPEGQPQLGAVAHRLRDICDLRRRGRPRRRPPDVSDSSPWSGHGASDAGLEWAGQDGLTGHETVTFGVAFRSHDVPTRLRHRRGPGPMRVWVDEAESR